MPRVSGLFITLFCTVLLSLPAKCMVMRAEAVDLEWQLPVQWSGVRKLPVRFRAQASQKQKNRHPQEGRRFNGEVTVTGRVGQQFIVCAGDVLSDDFIQTSAVADADHVHALTLIKGTGLLKINNGKACPGWLRQYYPHDMAQLLLSTEAFLAIRQEKSRNHHRNHHRNHESQMSALPSGFFESKDASLVSLTGGSSGLDDHNDDKRPPFMPVPDKMMANLLLLPTLNLPSNWRDLLLSAGLPFTRVYHWLTDQPEAQAGLTLLVQFDGQPPITLRISQGEYPEMAEQLLNARQLLRWLAHKLNGREAMILLLMDLLEDSETLADETANSIRRQLRIVLDQPDTEYSLTFELDQLNKNLGENSNPTARIVHLPNGIANQQSGETRPDDQAGKKDADAASGSHNTNENRNEEKSPSRQNAEQQPNPASSPGAGLSQEQAQSYFLLNVNGHPFKVARSHLDPEKRGQEDASVIYASQSEQTTLNLPLTMLEEKAGVSRDMRLPETDQKPLNYLVTYGTDNTRQALIDFYPVDILMLTQDNHLVAANQSGKPNEDCSICQESLHRYRGAIKTVCQHMFHLPCLITYFKNQPGQEPGEVYLKCPLCRRDQTRLGQLLANHELLSQQLLYASGQGQEKVVRGLLEAKVNTEVADEQGCTPLHRAVVANNLGIVVLLITGGSRVNKENHQGLTAVDLASMNGYRPIVEALSEAIGESSIFYWVAYRFENEIERWVDNGEDPEVTRKTDDSTLLHIAAARGYEKIAEKLLLYAENLNPVTNIINRLNKLQQTPLCAACDNDQYALVQLLLNHGATARPLSPEEKGPLYLAAKKGCPKIVMLLLAEQQDYEAVELINALIIAARHGRHETVRALLPHVTPFKTKSSSALLEAAQQGHWQVVSTLLDAGITESNPMVREQALVSAVTRGHIRTARLLIRLLMPQSAFSNPLVEDLAFSLLMQSVEADQPEMIRVLLDYGVPPNRSREGDGVTALIRASDHGYLDTVKALLEHGADVNQATASHFGAKTYTSLQLATMNGHADVKKVLLENIAKVTSRLLLPKMDALNYQLFDAVIKRNIGEVETLVHTYNSLNTGNALYYAAHRGLLGIAAFLLGQGADPNYTRVTEGNTPLHGAVMGGHKKLIQLLLEKKASPVKQNLQGIQPLDIASRDGKIEALTLLTAALQNEATKELKGSGLVNAGNALYHGAANGQYEIVKWLLSNKTDPDSINTDLGGQAPLHAAVRNNHPNIIRLLLENGANPDIKDNDGHTPMDVARQYHQKTAETELRRITQGMRLLEACHNGNAQGAQEWLQNGAEPDYQGSDGRTPIHIASEAARLDLVNLLLYENAQPDLSDGHYTPLHLAAINGAYEVTESLLSAGANPLRFTTGQEQQGELPLHLAIRNNHQDIVRLFIESGKIDINRYNGQQRNGLHIAARAMLPDMVDFLLSLGAEPKLTDNEGNTLLHIICRVFSEEQLRSFLGRHNSLLADMLRELQRNRSDETPLALLWARSDISESIKSDFSNYLINDSDTERFTNADK